MLRCDAANGKSANSSLESRRQTFTCPASFMIGFWPFGKRLVSLCELPEQECKSNQVIRPEGCHGNLIKSVKFNLKSDDPGYFRPVLFHIVVLRFPL